MLAKELEKKFTSPGRALIWCLVLPLVIFLKVAPGAKIFFLKFLGDQVPVLEYEKNLIFRTLVPVLGPQKIYENKFRKKIIFKVFILVQKPHFKDQKITK